MYNSMRSNHSKSEKGVLHSQDLNKKSVAVSIIDLIKNSLVLERIRYEFTANGV